MVDNTQVRYIPEWRPTSKTSGQYAKYTEKGGNDSAPGDLVPFPFTKPFLQKMWTIVPIWLGHRPPVIEQVFRKKKHKQVIWLNFRKNNAINRQDWDEHKPVRITVFDSLSRIMPTKYIRQNFNIHIITKLPTKTSDNNETCYTSNRVTQPAHVPLLFMWAKPTRGFMSCAQRRMPDGRQL